MSDPLTGIFAALTPDRTAASRRPFLSRPVQPARRIRHARKAVRRLAGPFFRSRPWLAPTGMPLLPQVIGRRGVCSPSIFGLPAHGLGHMAGVPSLTTSASRTHDREDDLQAAADKLGATSSRPISPCRLGRPRGSRPRQIAASPDGRRLRSVHRSTHGQVSCFCRAERFPLVNASTAEGSCFLAKNSPPSGTRPRPRSGPRPCG